MQAALWPAKERGLGAVPLALETNHVPPRHSRSEPPSPPGAGPGAGRRLAGSQAAHRRLAQLAVSRIWSSIPVTVLHAAAVDPMLHQPGKAVPHTSRLS